MTAGRQTGGVEVLGSRRGCPGGVKYVWERVEEKTMNQEMIELGRILVEKGENGCWHEYLYELPTAVCQKCLKVY